MRIQSALLHAELSTKNGVALDIRTAEFLLDRFRHTLPDHADCSAASTVCRTERAPHPRPRGTTVVEVFR